MKNNKILSLFLSLLLVCSVLPLTSAAESGVISYWIDTDEENLTVMQGDLPQYAVLAHGYSSYSIRVELVKDDVLVETLHRKSDINGRYYKLLAVPTGGLELDGDYQIRTTTVVNNAITDEDVLNLHVDVPAAGNAQPSINSAPSLEVDENEDYYYNLHATDADNDQLTYTFVQKPSWINGERLNNNNFQITGTAPEVVEDYNYVVTVRVSDNDSSVLQTFTITVRDTDAPERPPVSSIFNLSLGWSDVNSNIHSINLGETAEFNYEMSSDRSTPFNLRINLRKNGVLISTVVEVNDYLDNGETFNGTYELADELARAGTYTVEAEVISPLGGPTTKETLNLIVERGTSYTLPVMNQIADQEVNEGETLTFTVSATSVNPIVSFEYEGLSQSNSNFNGQRSGLGEDRRSNNGGFWSNLPLNFLEDLYDLIFDHNNDNQRNSDLGNFDNNRNDVNINNIDHFLSDDVFNTLTGEFTYSPNYDVVAHPDLSGYLNLRFRAYDGQSYSDWEKVKITINDVNRVPTVTLFDVPDAVVVNSEVTLTADATDADNDQLSYVWRIEETGTDAPSVLRGNSIVTSFDSIGTYIVAVVVNDDLGGRVLEKKNVTITERPPVEGCMDENALNFDSEATIQPENACEYPPVSGCTDDDALNFNEEATVDDGSCEFPLPNRNAYFKRIHLVNEEVYAGNHVEMGITIVNNGNLDLEDLRVSVMIYDFNLKKISGKFDLDRRDEKNLNMVLPLPAAAQSGQYLVKVTVGNDRFHESAYRQITVI